VRDKDILGMAVKCGIFIDDSVKVPMTNSKTLLRFVRKLLLENKK
jgi:hypothetical protein